MLHSHGALARGQTHRVASPDYVRRNPEEGVLYQVVAKNYNTFLAAVEMEGKRLPSHVTDEFEAFLDCGILSRGFIRFRCEGCKHERITALACKKRGFCSSCGGRRMVETAAHLVGSVFPKVGVRQYVVSFPFQIRYLLLRDSKILSHTLAIVHRALSGYLKKKLKNQGTKGRLQIGAVSLIQRFGGSWNANPHFHCLVLDGGFLISQEESPPKFCESQSPTDDEIKSLIKTIATRVVRYLKKQGHFQEDLPTLNTDELKSDEVLPELQD
jgi:hypothetical protein